MEYFAENSDDVDLAWKHEIELTHDVEAQFHVCGFKSPLPVAETGREPYTEVHLDAQLTVGQRFNSYDHIAFGGLEDAESAHKIVDDIDAVIEGLTKMRSVMCDLIEEFPKKDFSLKDFQKKYDEKT